MQTERKGQINEEDDDEDGEEYGDMIHDGAGCSEEYDMNNQMQQMKAKFKFKIGGGGGGGPSANS